MYSNFLKVCYTTLLVVGMSCSSKVKDKAPAPDLSNQKHNVIQIDQNTSYQTIANFGASDAWSCQFVGLWPDAKKGKMADLLFSKEFDEAGNPKGIGLSLWRFNLGAGSAEQGAKSGIRDPWRRAASFWDGTHYDWNKLKGQVWFAKAAKARGAEKLLLFANSPPVHLTRNGKAFTSDKFTTNISPQNYDAFANYLTDVVEGLKSKGLKVDYVSPFNEPQWDWADGGQEGNPYWNEDIFKITKAINSAFLSQHVDAEIDITEAAQLDYLYKDLEKKNRGDQIHAFFKSESPYYLGDLSKVGSKISAHSYFTTSPESLRIKTRQLVHKAVDQVPNLEFWMSEYCILGDNAGEIEGNKRDLGMKSALYMAKVIHSDLVDAEAAAWHWWTAISAYDYKDGLIYIDKNEEDGNFYESKMLWVLGNYSRFIRPGFKRVAIKQEAGNKTEALKFSAYSSPDTSQLVVVLVNSSAEEKPLRIELLENAEAQQWDTYTTSATQNLKFKAIEGPELIVPAESVMTVTSKIKS